MIAPLGVIVKPQSFVSHHQSQSVITCFAPIWSLIRPPWTEGGRRQSERDLGTDPNARRVRRVENRPPALSEASLGSPHG
jgi:hypothetical protein